MANAGSLVAFGNHCDKHDKWDFNLHGRQSVGEKIITTPPELCIEILSPEDTLTKAMERIRDYFSMGVSSCWIIDPVSHEGWVATPGRLLEALDGILRSNGIEMPLAGVLEPAK